MRLNGKNKTKSQRDDKIKIYNDYICFVELNTVIVDLVPLLKVFSNWITIIKLSRANCL